MEIKWDNGRAKVGDLMEGWISVEPGKTKPLKWGIRFPGGSEYGGCDSEQEARRMIETRLHEKKEEAARAHLSQMLHTALAHGANQSREIAVRLAVVLICGEAAKLSRLGMIAYSAETLEWMAAETNIKISSLCLG